MSTRELNRVVFHSKEDGAVAHYLKKAEDLLDNLDMAADKDLNDLLELYNIKEYFDNGLFLPTWDETKKIGYQEKIIQSDKKIKQFFFALNDEDIIESVRNLEFNYRQAYWFLFNYLQVYKKINRETFSKLLKEHPHQIRYILTHFNTVTHFDTEIRSFLIEYEKSAELFLSKFEQGDGFRDLPYIFPKSLTLADKEDIILQYINQDDPNLNYVRLIEHSRDSNDLTLSVKTRLKAKKKSDDLNKKIFEKGVSWQMGVQITLVKDQEEPVRVSREGHLIDYSYSVKFLDDQPNDLALFMLFRNLFGFTDETGLITLYNRLSEMDVMERLFIKSKNEYPKGIRFLQKNQTAFVQVLSFNHYLVEKNRSIEELIQSFIHLALNKETMVAGLHLRFPGNDASFLERIRILAPELEFLLKQYQVFVIEGKIDFELIEIDSNPLAFSEVKSLLKKSMPTQVAR